MNRRGVLHVRASRFVGGPERQILRYAKLAEDAGAESTLASFVGDGEGEALLGAAQKEGIATLALPAGTAAALRALVRFLREKPQALICTHGYKADILGIMAGRWTGTPVASFLRGWTAEDAKVRAYEAMNRALLRFSNRVVCLSEKQRAEMDAAGHAGRTRVVINAIEALPEKADARAVLRQALGLPATARVVACAGRLSPEKGTSYFVQAAKALQQQFPETYFVVFGDGAMREALDKEAVGIERLVMAGHRSDFRELIGGVDLLVNPSLKEEMPNVVLEAMAAGVPVVATKVGGVVEIAGPKPALELVAPGDAHALTGAMRTLLSDSNSARSLGEAGRQRVREAYSPAKQQEQLIDLLYEFMPPVQELTPLPERPFISVVMPVRNEEKHIGAVLEQLAAQDYPSDRFEVLVADGNSTDGTRRVVEEFATSARMPVRWLLNPKQLSSAGRNVGALASRGEVIAFIDGHCQIPTRALLANIAALMRETGAACLCRPQPLQVEGNTRFQDALARTRATVIGHGRDSTIFDMEQERFVNPTSSGAVYRAEVFETVGMYDESFDACEDVEFNHRVWRAGFKSYSSPKVAVLYSPRKSLTALWKQLVRYGRGRYRFMRKHPDAVSAAQLVPAAFVLWLAGLALSAPFSAAAGWALAGTILIYGGVTLAFAIRLSFRYGWHHLLISPAVYVCIHGGLGTGFWQEALLGRKPEPGAPVQTFDRPAPQPLDEHAQRPPAELTSATANKR